MKISKPFARLGSLSTLQSFDPERQNGHPSCKIPASRKISPYRRATSVLTVSGFPVNTMCMLHPLETQHNDFYLVTNYLEDQGLGHSGLISSSNFYL
ncbi:MAG: hypothetical protein HUJ51_05425 [Eggerthellaceae bacterium]|nr:hypothetical protein [Eggerthellaceae bacterium]